MITAVVAPTTGGARVLEELIVEQRTGFGAESLRHPTRASSVILLAFDLVAVAVALVAFRWTVQRGVPFLVVLFALLMMRGHYRTRMRRDGGEDAATLIGSLVIAAFIGLVLVGLLNVVEPQISTVVAASAGLLVILMLSRAAAFVVLRRLRRAGHLRSRAVVVGTGPIAREIGIEFGHRRHYGVDVAGYVAIDQLDVEARLPGAVIGNVDDLATLVRLTNSDRVLVTVSNAGDSRITDAIRSIEHGAATIFVMPQLFELGFGSDSMTPDRARGFALVRLGRSAHPVFALQFKRLFDILASLIALTVLSPVLFTVAVAVTLTSRGPVLFRQTRLGQGEVEFELLKFRSLKVNSDSDTAWTPDGSAADYTKIGKLLRWSSLDELPQLFNILNGDMSVVGPRPERPAFVDEFNESVPGYLHRHRLPVGLTGLAQVRGLRGDTPLAERVKADNLYIDQWSFFGDMKIILSTLWSIARQRNYAEAEIQLDAQILRTEVAGQIVVDLVDEHRRVIGRDETTA